MDILSAVKFALHAHSRHVRCFDQKPFALTPIESAETLEKSGVRDPDILCAAVLHHVLRNTNCTPQMLYDRFSRRTVDILLELNEEPQNRLVRKKIDIQKASSRSVPAGMVIVADSYSHVKQIIDYSVPKWSLIRKVGFCVWKRELVSYLPEEVKTHALCVLLLKIIEKYVGENRVNGKEVTIEEYYKELAY